VIQGIVSRTLVPTVKLVLVGVGAQETEIEAEVDTGFNGGISLPLECIRALGWIHRAEEKAVLADGREVSVDIYRGIVLWRGAPRLVFVMAAEAKALVGVGLLGGNRLTIDFHPGGQVLISPLPEPAS
jgi:clan AA aspartic protease